VLEAVLEAGRLAPSWANTQCWRFIVVRDPALKDRLAAVLSEKNPATEAVKHAPIVIVACAELGQSGYYSGKVSTEKGDWYLYDVALALENMALAAHSLGLGTVHVGLFDMAKTAQLLDVPRGFTVVAIMPLGYPDQTPTPRPRKELSQIVFYDRFGNSQR
jgi:nitroreductase